ncbi:MAG: glycosyltransferase family 39 protein [Planctomycetes bacterium]|nr:glycosyltransferase family 39 protein [Planctomycetota bacterium]
MAASAPPRYRIDRLGALVLLALLALAAAGLWRESLWGPTEPRVIQIAREQYATNGLLGVPTFAGMPFLEKPLLYYSHVALHFHLFGGPSVLAARLATLFWALLWIAAVVLIVRRVNGPRAGLLAGMLLATAPLFCRLARRVQLDVALAALLTLALLFFAAALCARRGNAARWSWLACAACVGLATLTKGILGLALFLLPAAVYALWSRDRRVWRALVWPPALLLLLGPLALWALRLYLAGGLPFVLEAFVNNTLGRFVHFQFELPETAQLSYADVGDTSPWWYYLHKALTLAGPSLFGLPFALHALARGRFGRGARGRLARIALCWAVVVPVLLSFSGQKGIHHIGACTSGFVILVVLWLDRWLRTRTRRPVCATAGTLAMAAVAAAPVALAVNLAGGLATMTAVVVASISVGILGLAAACVAFLTGSGRLVAFGLGGAAIAFLVVGFSPGAVARTDRQRSLGPFAAWLAEESEGTRVGVYFEGDHVLGAVAFALDQPVTPVLTLEEARGFLESERASLLVVPDVVCAAILEAAGGPADVAVFARGGNASRRIVVVANRAALVRRPEPTNPPPDPGRARR